MGAAGPDEGRRTVEGKGSRVPWAFTSRTATARVFTHGLVPLRRLRRLGRQTWAWRLSLLCMLRAPHLGSFALSWYTGHCRLTVVHGRSPRACQGRTPHLCTNTSHGVGGACVVRFRHLCANGHARTRAGGHRVIRKGRRNRALALHSASFAWTARTLRQAWEIGIRARVCRKMSVKTARAWGRSVHLCISASSRCVWRIWPQNNTRKICLTLRALANALSFKNSLHLENEDQCASLVSARIAYWFLVAPAYAAGAGRAKRRAAAGSVSSSWTLRGRSLNARCRAHQALLQTLVKGGGWRYLSAAASTASA